MLFLLGVLLFVLFCLTVLIRALLLFPLRGRRQGWSPALRRYALSLLLCGGVLLWELGALYGFSWQHMGRADRQQMADAAVAFAYTVAAWMRLAAPEDRPRAPGLLTCTSLP